MKGDEQEPALSCPRLDLKRIVGFNGNVKDGLHIVEGMFPKFVIIIFLEHSRTKFR